MNEPKHISECIKEVFEEIDKSFIPKPVKTKTPQEPTELEEHRARLKKIAQQPYSSALTSEAKAIQMRIDQMYSHYEELIDEDNLPAPSVTKDGAKLIAMFPVSQEVKDRAKAELQATDGPYKKPSGSLSEDANKVYMALKRLKESGKKPNKEMLYKLFETKSMVDDAVKELIDDGVAMFRFVEPLMEFTESGSDDFADRLIEDYYKNNPKKECEK